MIHARVLVMGIVLAAAVSLADPWNEDSPEILTEKEATYKPLYRTGKSVHQLSEKSLVDSTVEELVLTEEDPGPSRSAAEKDSVDVTGIEDSIDPAKIAEFADQHAPGEHYSAPPTAAPTVPTAAPTAPTATPTDSTPSPTHPAYKGPMIVASPQDDPIYPLLPPMARHTANITKPPMPPTSVPTPVPTTSAPTTSAPTLNMTNSTQTPTPTPVPVVVQPAPHTNGYITSPRMPEPVSGYERLQALKRRHAKLSHAKRRHAALAPVGGIVTPLKAKAWTLPSKRKIKNEIKAAVQNAIGHPLGDATAPAPAPQPPEEPSTESEPEAPPEGLAGKSADFKQAVAEEVKAELADLKAGHPVQVTDDTQRHLQPRLSSQDQRIMRSHSKLAATLQNGDVGFKPKIVAKKSPPWVPAPAPVPPKPLMTQARQTITKQHTSQQQEKPNPLMVEAAADKIVSMVTGHPVRGAKVLPGGEAADVDAVVQESIKKVIPHIVSKQSPKQSMPMAPTDDVTMPPIAPPVSPPFAKLSPTEADRQVLQEAQDGPAPDGPFGVAVESSKY